MKKLLLTLFSLCAAVFCTSAAENLAASLPIGSSHWANNQHYDKTQTSTDGAWTLVNFNNNNNSWNGFIRCGRKDVASNGEIITANPVSYAVNKAVLKIQEVNYPESLTETNLYIADNVEFTNATKFSFGTITAGNNAIDIDAPVKNAYYKVEFVCTGAAKNGVVSVSGFELYTTEEVTTEPDPDPEPEPEPGEAIKTLAAWLDAKPTVDTPLAATLTAIYQNGSYLWVTDGDAFALVYGKLDKTYVNGDQIPAPVSGKYTEYSGMPEMVPVASTFGTPTAGTAVAAVPVKIADLTAADVARYVRLDNVEITAGASDVSFTASDGENTVVLYNRYSKTVTIPETTDATVYGFVAVYKETIQVYPILIEDEGETPVNPDPDPEPEPEPTGGTALFNFTDPAGLTPAQAKPGDGQENAVVVTDVTFTNGPVALSFDLPEGLSENKNARLYLYKSNVELRTYSGTSMTIAGTGVKLTEITFDVNYDDSFNATASTGTVTPGKPAKWEGKAGAVTFNFTGTTKINKMTVAYTTSTGIETIETVNADAATYYDLQGRRVANPANGLFIRVQGGHAEKVIL